MTNKWGRMTTTYPKLGDSQLSLREERPHGETPHLMRVHVPSPNRPYPWSGGARNLGGKIRGRRGLWPFVAKRPKFTQKLSLEKSYLCITRERSLWTQTEALLPFCNKGWGSKQNGSILNTPILEAHYLWEKVHISAILICTDLWDLEEQKYV